MNLNIAGWLLPVAIPSQFRIPILNSRPFSAVARPVAGAYLFAITPHPARQRGLWSRSWLPIGALAGRRAGAVGRAERFASAPAVGWALPEKVTPK